MTPSEPILQIKIPGRKAVEIPLERFPVTLGRAPVNEILIDHPSVSRRHARLDREGSVFFLEDLVSSHGTRLKKKIVEPGTRVPFRPGDAIQLGEVVVKVKRPRSRYERPKRIIFLAAAGVLAFIAFLCAGVITLTQSTLLSGEKTTLASCESPPMPLIQRSGVSFQISSGTAPPVSPDTSDGLLNTNTPPVLTAGPGTPTLTPGLLLPTPPPGRPIVSLAFLELPFPYDGGNEAFGGTLAQFKQASQLSYLGGRINSYFDHLLPLYPSSKDPAVPGGQEPAEPPIGENILLFDGSLSGNINYSGHPAYDYSTFVRRQPTTPLFAAADGVIYSVGIHGASGALFVKIKHTVPEVGDFLTIYWHLHPDEFYDAMVGREGEFISAGTRIGTMGNTGYSTGHHLHFEVRFDRNHDGAFAASEVVDPYGFIPSAEFPEDPWTARNAPVSNYLWVHPLGLAAMVPPSGGGALDPGGGTGGIGGVGVDAALCAPANSLPPGGTVYWSWAPDPPPEVNRQGTNHACVLSVFDAEGNPVTSFDPPLTIRIPFSAADLAVVNPDSLFIHLLPPGEQDWVALPTQLDLENGVATALTDRPGKCALLGEPLTDLIPPTTTIEFSGEASPDGSWVDTVTVSLRAADPSGIARMEYSLDAGTTWEAYTGPFQINPAGIPEPVAIMDEEFFAGGPGRFLILASATDGAGNNEDPPAFRSLVIDPSKKTGDSSQAAGQPSQTPTTTATSTPTLPPPGPEFACAESLEIIQNAFCRTGPGTVYDVLTAYTTGITLTVEGQNADPAAKWWWVKIPDTSSHCWVSDSTVAIAGTTSPSCVPVLAAPATPTPSPTDTPTPIRPVTPTPNTATPGDTQPPPAPSGLSPGGSASLGCAGSAVLSWSPVSDSSGIQRYEWSLESSTTGETGPWFPAGSGQASSTSATNPVSCGIWYRWHVRAVDGSGNTGAYSPYAYFSVVIS